MKLMDPRFPWRMLETLCSSKNLLKNSMSCLGCNTAMSPISCSSSKSPDGLIWRCSHCKKYKNIRTDSALSCSSIKGLYGIAISQMTGPSEKTGENCVWLEAGLDRDPGPGYGRDSSFFPARQYWKPSQRLLSLAARNDSASPTLLAFQYVYK